MKRATARWAVSGLAGLCAVLLTWVLLGQSSPLADSLAFHVGPANLWRRLNAVPFIAAAVVAGNPAGGSFLVFTILQFGQWFLIAFVLSILFEKAFGKNR